MLMIVLRGVIMYGGKVEGGKKGRTLAGDGM